MKLSEYPRYRIIQVVTTVAVNRPESDPFVIERSFDYGKTWSALESFVAFTEASEAKQQWEQSWDGANSYVG